jgi:hypothetical protein
LIHVNARAINFSTLENGRCQKMALTPGAAGVFKGSVALADPILLTLRTALLSVRGMRAMRRKLQD